MGWAQLVILLLSILRQLKKSRSAEAFAQDPLVSQFDFNGDLLRKIWENREEIVAFIVKIWEMFNRSGDQPMVPTSGEENEVSAEELIAELKA